MEPYYMTKKEVAEFLRMSIATIDRLIQKGKIPSYKVGRKRLFKKEDLINWVESQKEGGELVKPLRPSKTKKGRR